MLSIKGREPFIRMQLWLNDPTSVDKLNAIRAERLAENAKRKRGAAAMSETGHSDPSSPSGGADFSDQADSPGSAGGKKPRVQFTTKQKEALKIAFSLDPYPSLTAMEFLSQELNLEARSISNWFHNHRMRLKQTHDVDTLLAPQKDELQRPLDPLHFRLLVNQRLLEMSSAASPPDSPSAAAAGDNKSGPGSESSGLDLTQSRHRELDQGSDDGESAASASAVATSAPLPGRSRRKPLAPQWVNPATREKEEGDAVGGSVPNAGEESVAAAAEEEEEVADVD